MVEFYAGSWHATSQVFTIFLQFSRFFLFQLKGLDLPDAEDKAFINYDSNLDIGQRLDTISSISDIAQRKLEVGIDKKELIDKDEVRRAIGKIHIALCSRNFQKVNLRLDFNEMVILPPL